MNELFQNAFLRLLSRKFILCILTLGSSHYLVSNSYIADGVYSAVIMATVAVYVAGNVAQKIKAETK